jgi:hypothetical protein
MVAGTFARRAMARRPQGAPVAACFHAVRDLPYALDGDGSLVLLSRPAGSRPDCSPADEPAAAPFTPPLRAPPGQNDTRHPGHSLGTEAIPVCVRYVVKRYRRVMSVQGSSVNGTRRSHRG